MDADLLLLLAGWCAATLRSATPLLFVTLGETLTQRTGVINLGVEGEMLAGACTGFGVAVATGDPWLGLGAGALAGATLSLLHAGLVLGTRANQIGSGIAVWIIALGTTSYFGRAFVGQQVTPLAPFATWGREGSFLHILFGQMTAPVPLAVVAVFIAAWWLFRTRAGLAWRVVGESAAVAAENGLKPTLIRFQGIVVGGLLAGFGGAVLSIDYTQTWAQEITKGRGLIAVGLVIVARWQPLLVLPICLLFGLAEVGVLRAQAAGLEGSSYLTATAPYLAVLVVLILGHVLARRASGMPADLRAIFS
jgi:general nucleoside transport system permease protein